ncbi:TauD/TfdA family dioxygenase [Pseudoalteromonas sp. SMS1]|uniref:TauD/TfdA family dioxygenase n=1 Tax=Pseudoalteromonas sp. SMS1 TaxID=2908894 RepID=UPI001F1BFB68|nr:TauD/TfdA family dioxygenase [Pseudoalteromonas sp. SMS1]MCF2856178.1 TauD/TfdA family dioxygenase [Pseudoalteromonas sp. SMS1]
MSRVSRYVMSNVGKKKNNEIGKVETMSIDEITMNKTLSGEGAPEQAPVYTDLANVTVKELRPVNGVPLRLNVDTQNQKVKDWATDNAEHIERLLQQNGALLIRGLKFLGSKQFGQVLASVFSSPLINYSFRSTPRTELRGNVYTATEYHSDQTIPQHNENSYTNNWAMRVGFLSTIVAQEGGATPISDSRKVYESIPVHIRDKFAKLGVMYVRNYSEIDVPWQEVFQTENKHEVEAYCLENQLDFEWLDDNHLRTKQVNQAVIDHPITGEKVWFNQAHLFHVSNLEQSVRDSLLNVMSEDQLPRNTYYGDGSPIELETLQIIRDALAEHTIRFDWQCNDLMLLDNMLFAHGREPFKGERQVLVGMAKPYKS